MNASDIVGWAADGQVLCEDCATHAWIKANDAYPVFASTEVTDHDLTCDECGEVIIEVPTNEYTVLMQGAADWRTTVYATGIEQAIKLAESGEDMDGDILDEDDLETHDAEATFVYQRGVKNDVWRKTFPEPQPDLSWATEPYIITHPALRPQFPDGIKMSVDTLADDNAPMGEGLMLTFLAYVACVAGIELEKLSIYDLNVFQWEDGDWVAIT